MTEQLTIQREEQSTEIKKEPSKKLIVYNDYVNTFDWVIKALVEICKHDETQAEQSSLMIHHKGKYAVKVGSLKDLKPMKEGILDRGINATID